MTRGQKRRQPSGKYVLDLSKMQRCFEDLHGGKPLDEVGSEAYVRIIGKFRKILNTPGLLDLIHAYQTTLSDEDEAVT